LQREVAERERQLTRARRELSDARYRLALAEGNRELAIRELRKVVLDAQNDVDWVHTHANWYCDPRDLFTQADWDLAKVRAELAEHEGDAATLVVERRKVVEFYRQRMLRLAKLEQHLALNLEEVSPVTDELEKAQGSLATAEKLLSGAQDSKPAPKSDERLANDDP
jgi:hypothetical protein